MARARRRVRVLAVVGALVFAAQVASPPPAGAASVGISGLTTLTSHMLDQLGIDPGALSALIDEQVDITMGPAMTQLKYAFCNGLTCGTSENANCTVDLYIPGFVGEILRKLQVPPPVQGAQLKWFAMAHGPTTPTAFAGLDSPPSGSLASMLGATNSNLDSADSGSDGVNMNFGFGPFQAALNPAPPLGDSCGVPESQRTDVTDKNPDGIENDYARTLLRLQWQVDGIALKNAIKSGGFSLSALINGQSNGGMGGILPGLPDQSGSKPTIYSQQGPVGTVATELANMMNQLGVGLTPSQANDALQSGGPGQGTPINSTIGNSGFLSSMFQNVAHSSTEAIFSGSTTPSELAKAYSAGQVVGSVASQLPPLTAPTAVTNFISWGQTGSTPGSAAVITSYNPANDSFSAINAVGQQVNLTYNAVSSLMNNLHATIMQIARSAAR